MQSSLCKKSWSSKALLVQIKHKTDYVINSLPLSLVVLAFVVVCFVFTLDFPK